MPQNRFAQFFLNQKSKFNAFQERGNLNVLELKYRNFLKILREIENHLEYESELESQNVSKNLVDFYNAEKYLPKINSKILKSFSGRNSCLKFFQLLMCFDYSDFKHVNEKIYAELLFKMISLVAENNSLETNVLIRKIYEYNCIEADSQKVHDFITKMLQFEKDSLSDKQNEKESLKEEENDEKKPEADKDFFAETKSDANGIKIIKGLLFAYGIDDEKTLRKSISKVGAAHFFLWVILPLILCAFVFLFFMQEDNLKTFAAKIAENLNSPSKNYIVEVKDVLPFVEYLKWVALIPFVLFAFFNFRTFVFRKSKIRYLKKAISKIASAAEISEDYIFEKLKLRYGEKIRKFLQ